MPVLRRGSTRSRAQKIRADPEARDLSTGLVAVVQPTYLLDPPPGTKDMNALAHRTSPSSGEALRFPVDPTPPGVRRRRAVRSPSGGVVRSPPRYTTLIVGLRPPSR